MYRIIEACNPYNARTHYRGEDVIEYDGATPVKWIVEDTLETEDEAKAALMRLAKSMSDYISGSWGDEDDESIAEWVNVIKEDHPEDFEDGESPDMSWYKGPGIYDHDGRIPFPVIIIGETSFQRDVESYWIEEY